MGKDEVIQIIRAAFGSNPYPGDAFLQGSFDGCEPYDEVSSFFGQTDWTRLEPRLLDEHYGALSFFSEGGLRFFLPAYLIADLREELHTADPLFHLWHGLASAVNVLPVGSQTFRRDSSGNALLNPRRYGAMTWSDSARHRLSVFTREEAQAIVAYLEYRRDRDKTGVDKARIEEALNEFWLDRARQAPTRAAIEAHLRAEEEFTAALLREHGNKSS